jgi:hypothetical protein
MRRDVLSQAEDEEHLDAELVKLEEVSAKQKYVVLAWKEA